MPKVHLDNGYVVDVSDLSYDELVSAVIKEPTFVSSGNTYFSKHVVEVEPDEKPKRKAPVPRPQRGKK